MQFQNQIVLITGGGSGIGLAFSSALLQRGNKVIICGRNSQKLLDAQKMYSELEVVTCDITQKQDVEELFKYIQDQYGVLHLLINNAGIQYKLNFLDDHNVWGKIAQEININLTAHIQLTQYFLPLLHRGDSAIVNITSALAFVPKQSAPVYCASKAGLANFTRTLRYQLYNEGIKVFEIIPALVDTAMTASRNNKRKISAEILVKESLQGIKKNHQTILIERAKILMLIYRIIPNIAYRLMRNK